MEKFNKHIVRENETLKSIASQYNLSSDSLKKFHNDHCDIKGMILISLTDQKELFIPRTAISDKTKLVDFGSGNRLIFNPRNLLLKYGVRITMDHGDRKNEIKYDASVRWLKTENQLHFFEIDRISKFYINEEEVNEMADLLAYKASKVLYPLYISADENGKMYSVENTQEYAKRWNTVKEEIEKEYEGEIVEEYCRKTEKVLSEPELLTELMKKDYFLRTWFFGIYRKYGKDYETTENETFPVVKNPIEPNFKVRFEIDPLKDEYDQINIEGYGILNDGRSVYDFINRAPFSFIAEDNPEINENGSFRIQFYLNGKTSLPESLYLESDIMLDEKKKISVMISRLEEQ